MGFGSIGQRGLTGEKGDKGDTGEKGATGATGDPSALINDATTSLTGIWSSQKISDQLGDIDSALTAIIGG